MKKKKYEIIALIGLFSILLFTLLLTGCAEKQVENKQQLNLDHVNQSILPDVRLGDGVPLDIRVAIRWHILDINRFTDQFPSSKAYDSLVLNPKSLEIAGNVANTYLNVDSVFTVDRKVFIDDMKRSLKSQLGEEAVEIKEVIVSDIFFPDTYTEAREQVAMKERELELIRESSKVELEAAQAARTKAQAEGEVDVAKAQLEGELAQIKSQTEAQRRQNELARAETQAQVQQLQAVAEAKRKKLMAKAELERQEDLKDLQMKKQKEQEQIAIAKERELQELKYEQQEKLAKLTATNPSYASFLVNKELASKVEIAVLPSGMDGNLFGDFLKTNMK